MSSANNKPPTHGGFRTRIMQYVMWEVAEQAMNKSLMNAEFAELLIQSLTYKDCSNHGIHLNAWKIVTSCPNHNMFKPSKLLLYLRTGKFININNNNSTRKRLIYSNIKHGIDSLASIVKGKNDCDKELFDQCDALLETLIKADRESIWHYTIDKSEALTVAKQIQDIIFKLLPHRCNFTDDIAKDLAAPLSNIHLLIRKLVEISIKLDIWNEHIFDLVLTAYLRKHQMLQLRKSVESCNCGGTFADWDELFLRNCFNWIEKWIWELGLKIDVKYRTTGVVYFHLYQLAQSPLKEKEHVVSNPAVKKLILHHRYNQRVTIMREIVKETLERSLMTPEFAQLLTHQEQMLDISDKRSDHFLNQ